MQTIFFPASHKCVGVWDVRMGVVGVVVVATLVNLVAAEVNNFLLLLYLWQN